MLKDFNENQEPRKRQRTISPEAGLTALDDQKTNDWADQLKSAAFGQSSTPRAMSDSGSSKDEGIPQYGKTSHKGSPKGQSATNLGPSDSENNVETTQSLKETPTEMLSKTPPKKMLRVRPNGKLDSPKAKATTLDTKPKRGRKPAKLNSKSKTLVATIKYGINEQSRTFLGHKINNVLSGKSIVNIFAKARAVRPTEPSKPTHPFFLGDTKRQQDPLTSNDGKTCGADNQPTTPKRKATSLTNARVTSKPPAASDSTAAMLGFGHNMFGFTQAPVSQFHGAMEPLWPPKEMVHVGRADLPHRPLAATQMFQAPKAHRKLKDVQVYISKEDEVIKPCMNIVHAYHNDIKLSHSVNPRQWRELRRPLRRIMTGRDLQQAIRNNIVSSLPISDMELHEDPDDDELSTSRALQSPAHCAIGHLFREIATSFTAFDKFECEPQDWVHKYAPVCAKHILQQGREVILLRDWLRTLTIKPVGGRNVNKCKIGSASAASKKPAGHCTKRKRKRVEELEGFVISSDEEAQEMDDINDPEDLQPTHALPRKSVIRSTTVENSGNGERITNTVVISGPHGCGKTAAVYAVARELGFEVFEINAGSRRSGKDILDKVGDMTRNHLVKHAKVNEETDFKEDLDGMELLSDQLEQDLDSGRQGTMTSFFKSEGTTKKAEAATKVKAQKNIPNQKKQPQTQQPQKQSLILLEEVDVLFEEDKSFWATTLELILQSKRPIIMTCTDEDLLPLENMVLYAIFRLIPPSVELATDYLLLIACNEGHLLSRDSISDLYKAKGSDLRASMTELNFFCQMAIGDTKGGLDWMLIHSSAEGLDKPKEDGLRVVSDGTYKSGMGCSIGEVGKPQRGGSLEQETAVLSEIWNGWNINIGATGHYVWSSSTPKEFSPSLALNALQNLDQVAEAMSAADTFPACIPLTSYMVSMA